MIKAYLKTTKLWKAISQSQFYHWYRDPVNYRKKQEETNFYKKLLKKHPSPNKLIFDVGANIGTKSKVFSGLAKKVIAFEPSEKLYNRLLKSFKNSNVEIYNCALGSKSGFLDLFIIEKNEAYNSLNKKHITETAIRRGITIIENVSQKKVKVELLEDFVNKYGIPKYIKIDVEGYEHEVLKGLQTPVPILSFEANLPEFKKESIQSLNYLHILSLNKYKFNFTSSGSFLLENFVSKEEAIKFLNNTELSYLEIYALLK